MHTVTRQTDCRTLSSGLGQAIRANARQSEWQRAIARFLLTIGAVFGMAFGSSDATAQIAGAEVISPVVTWQTNQQCAGGSFSTPEDAFAAIVQNCSSYCMVWNGITQANPTAYQVSGTVYQTCNPPTSRSDPITQPFALINGTGSCASFPGYMTGNPMAGYPFGVCYIWLVQHDRTQKPCDTCVGNPIGVGTGNKQQVETDYSSSGVAPLTFRRYYNSAPQFGQGWRTSFQLSITYESRGGKTTATLKRPDASYAFTLVGSTWVPDAGVNFKLSGSNGGFTVVTPDGDQELYDGYNKVYMVTSLAWAPRYTMLYDSSSEHRLTRVSDPFGHSINLTYDAQGRLSTMTDPSGAVYQYSYDANSNLTAVTFPDGSARQYVYNEPSLTAGVSQPAALTGIIDEASARYASFGYSAQGHAVLSEHAGGADRYTVSYATPPIIVSNATIDLVNHVKYVVRSYQAPSGVVVTDALGTARSYGFTESNGTIRSTGVDTRCVGLCSSTPQARTFDANGNATSETDFNGSVTTRTFDLSRNLETSRTEASGTATARTTTTTWHSTFRLPATISEPSRTTSISYNGSGMPLSRTVTDPITAVSRTSSYTYDSYDNVTTINGPRTDVSDVTTYTYYYCSTGYKCGHISTVKNALNQTTTYNTYNAHGQPLTITDPNGVVTTLTYDLRQRLTSRTVGTEVTSFEYWPTGLLKKATLPDGSSLSYTYDAAHRLTDIADSQGNRIHYTLDAMGNRTSEELFDPSNALMQTRTRVFNTLNQLWKEVGAAGTPAVTTEFGYDNNGNQTDINAPLGRNTDQQYDELNRLTQVTDPATGLTRYGYNALDQLISVTDPRNKVTSYTYNALGDLTQLVSPDTGTTSHTYDSAGNLSTKTDARSKTGTYSYDALNRVTSVTYPDQSIAYTWDQGANALGRLSSLTDGSGSTAWSYDSQGRVTSRQQTMSGIAKTVGYSYNAAGQLQSLTLPSGNVVSYGYTNGKVASLTLNGSTTLLSNVLYQPFGPTLGWTWGNATYAIREYDTDGKVTDIDSAGLRTYAYDDAFRITGITDVSDPAFSRSFAYDLLDRLTGATGTSLNQSWTYDANGNRLTQGGSQPSTYSISTTSNRLTSVTGALSKTYSYDAAGNITGDGTATFTYDDAGRMVSATKAGTATTYVLNALGQRVRKTTGGTSTYFVYDEAGHLIGEYDGSGSLVQETVWFGDIPVATLRPNGGGGVNAFYIHTDHLNTPRKISRPGDNVVVWRWDSDPFGTTAANQDPDGDAAPFIYNLRFPGQYFDTETGLYYNYFRDYDPQTGRYVQSDPIGLDGGINTYAYVGGNPLSFADPFGLYIPKDTANCKVSLFPAFERRYGERWQWFDEHMFKVVIPVVIWYRREVEVAGYAQKNFYWQQYNLYGLWEHNQNYLYICTETDKCGNAKTDVMSGNDSFQYEKFEKSGTRKWSDPWKYIPPFNHPPNKLPPPFPK